MLSLINDGLLRFLITVWITAQSTAASGPVGHQTSVIDPIHDVSGWAINADGGKDISFRADTTDYHSPPAAMRIAFAGNQWGNLRHEITVPPDAVAVALWVRVHKASPGTAMHIWLNEPDGDGHVARVTLDGRDPSDWPTEWTRIEVPLGRFTYDPRGDKKPDILAAKAMLLGFNFAPIEISADDVAWSLRKGPGLVAMPVTEPFQVEPGRLGRIAILDEPALGGPTAALNRMCSTLRSAGFGVTVLRAGDLADAQRLNRSNFDLLILPQSERFPVRAKDAVLQFLQSGGSLWTLGGYAFDQPVEYTSDGWKPLGTVATAAEIKAGQIPDARINTRFGKPGDAMTFNKMQIGMFDPSYALERVTRAEIGGRHIDGLLTGWAACITDPTGGPVSAKAHLRFVPLGRTFDRLGRPRGPLGGLAHHFAEPYAGSSWAFFGATNRDLLSPEGLPTDYVVSLARRLVDKVYLYGLTTDLACYRQGEPVKISVCLANRGRTPQTGELRLAIEDQVVHTRTIELPPDNGQSRLVEVTWAPKQFDKDFYRVRATLKLPYCEDELDNGFCVWNDAVVRAGPKVSLRDNYFRINDRPTFLTGTNQTGRMWLSEYENPLVWRDDFAGMRDHGMTLWRVLHFSAVMHRNDAMSLAGPIPEKVLRQTDAIVQLAQKYGVVLFLTLHDWMPVELSDEQLAAQAKWNAFWAERYKDVPGIMYDIQNEPSIGLPERPHVAAEWKRFLIERHGGIEAAADRWGLSPGDPSILKPHATGTSWTDLKAVDVEQFRVHILNRWLKANAEAVHKADSDALVTLGFLEGNRSADKVLGADPLDFANMHCYRPLRAFPSDFKLIDRRAVGKTLTLGEFGAREAHDLRVGGGTGEASPESIRRYLATNHYVFGLGGSFTASWCWRDMPDCIFPWGMVRSDELPKPVLQAYRNFTLMARFIQPRYEPPTVWLVLPDAHRLGPRWNDIQRAIDQTIDVLLGLRIGFGVLREKDLVAGVVSASMPSGGPVLIWPMPYCPDDATFAAVKRIVEAGGTLYLSGDVSFDDRRQPVKQARLTELGLTLEKHVSPFDEQPSGPIQRANVGKGRVFFVPYPVELGDRRGVQTCLLDFLSYAGVRHLPIEPEHPDLHAFATPTEDGATVYNMVNHGEPRTITLKAGTEPLSLPMAKLGCGLAMIDRENRLTMIEAQGPVQRGRQVLLDARADAILIAMDGRDVADSSRLLLMPNETGTLALVTRRTWAHPVATVGQIVNGVFTALEAVPLDLQRGRLDVNADDHRALGLILISEREDAIPAAEQVAATLTHGRR